MKQVFKDVIQLANGICERCGDIEERMHIHHRDRNRSNNHISNLDYLCGSCHNQVHWVLRRLERNNTRWAHRTKMLYKDKLYKPSYKLGKSPNTKAEVYRNPI
jgi:5-methylcytosine-specific restriction endonuclease McrA